MTKCDGLIKKLMKHKSAIFFSIPVDPVALKIPTYFDVIKNPMDLGTVANNIRSGIYTTPSEVYKNIKLTFRNCLTFNPPGN